MNDEAQKALSAALSSIEVAMLNMEHGEDRDVRLQRVRATLYDLLGARQIPEKAAR